MSDVLQEMHDKYIALQAKRGIVVPEGKTVGPELDAKLTEIEKELDVKPLALALAARGGAELLAGWFIRLGAVLGIVLNEPPDVPEAFTKAFEDG